MNFYNSSQAFNVGNQGFMYAIRLFNNTFDNNQLTFSFYQITWDINGKTRYDIDAEICTEEHFPSSIVGELSNQYVFGHYM